MPGGGILQRRIELAQRVITFKEFHICQTYVRLSKRCLIYSIAII